MCWELIDVAEKAKVKQWLETEATAMKKNTQRRYTEKKLSGCDTGRLPTCFKVGFKYVSSTRHAMPDRRWCFKQGLWGETCITLKFPQVLKTPCVQDKLLFLPECV